MNTHARVGAAKYIIHIWILTLELEQHNDIIHSIWILTLELEQHKDIIHKWILTLELEQQGYYTYMNSHARVGATHNNTHAKVGEPHGDYRYSFKCSTVRSRKNEFKESGHNCIFI